MKKKYEDACREAGMSEEKIKEIRKVFDNDRKKMKRECKSRDKYGIEIRSLSSFDGSGEERDIESPGMSVEDAVVTTICLQKLRSFLAEFEEHDREFILDCYEKKYMNQEIMQKKYNMTIDQIYYRRDKLLRCLRGKFDIGD